MKLNCIAIIAALAVSGQSFAQPMPSPSPAPVVYDAYGNVAVVQYDLNGVVVPNVQYYDRNGNLWTIVNGPAGANTYMVVPSPSPLAVAVPSATPSSSEIPLPSVTPTSSEIPLPSVTPTPSEIPSPSVTPSSSEIPLPSVTPTASEVPLPSETPSQSPAQSAAASPSQTPTPSASDAAVVGRQYSAAQTTSATTSATTPVTSATTTVASAPTAASAPTVASPTQAPAITLALASATATTAQTTASVPANTTTVVTANVANTTTAATTMTTTAATSTATVTVTAPVVVSSPVLPTPTASPAPLAPSVLASLQVAANSTDDHITCQIKNFESPLDCAVTYGVINEKECCRYSHNCGDLPKCTPSYCCQNMPSQAPVPSPSSVPVVTPVPNQSENQHHFYGYYEPVDQYINCAIKNYEGGFECGAPGREHLDYYKPCCRWSGMCGKLDKCMERTCCDSRHHPKPTKTPSPFVIKCSEKKNLKCKPGYEMKEDKKCCKYGDECGKLPKCSRKVCCDEVDEKPECPWENNRPEIEQPKDCDVKQVCGCSGAVRNGKCYHSLAYAIQKASSGETIYLSGKEKIYEPIEFSKDITLWGVYCDQKMAVVEARFNETDRAILELKNEESQSLKLKNLEFTSKDDVYAAAVHTLGSETDAGDQKVKMVLENVVMHDMKSQAPGVGLFIGQSSGLSVDANCVFYGMNMTNNEKEKYAGGAAIALIYLPEDSEVSIGGLFEDNVAFYPEGSKHSGGGAVYMDWIEGPTKFYARFEHNKANQGGAINVQGILGQMEFAGEYIHNKAIDDGFGSRAGAVRILDIKEGGSALLTGYFADNKAQGRGGAVATNMHRENSKMYLSGIFNNNLATTTGGVWSRWSRGTELEGKIVLKGEAEFEDNTSIKDNDRSSLYDIAGKHGDKMNENEWKGRTIRVN